MKLKEFGGGWACLWPPPHPHPPPPPERLPHLARSQGAGREPRTGRATATSRELFVVVRGPPAAGSVTRPPCSGRPPPSSWAAWPVGSKRWPCHAGCTDLGQGPLPPPPPGGALGSLGLWEGWVLRAQLRAGGVCPGPGENQDQGLNPALTLVSPRLSFPSVERI